MNPQFELLFLNTTTDPVYVNRKKSSGFQILYGSGCYCIGSVVCMIQRLL